MKLFRRFLACRSGSSAVEFAIVGSLFMLLSLGVVEFGRGLHLRNQIAFAADVGVRTALTKPGSPNATLDSAVRGAFRNGNPAQLRISFTNSGSGASATRQISISYPLVPVLPSIFPGSINLSVARRIPAA